MPLDRVKLDPPLIADIDACEKARVVVQAVIQLIQGVGCEVVAEAVENIAQADILRAMGCDTRPGLCLRPRRCSRTSSSPGSATPSRGGAQSSPKPSTLRTIRS